MTLTRLRSSPTRIADLSEQYTAIVDGMGALHDGFTPAELELVARYLEAMTAPASSV